MPTNLETVAKEKGTYAITCTFTDEDDAAVTPDSIVWSLTDTDGTVINNRDQVAVAVPASSVEIVLSGDDLEVTETAGFVERRFIVEIVFDSDLGNNLPHKDECTFSLENLTKVT